MLSWTHSSLALAGLHAASICRRDVQEDLQAWHANQSAAGTPRRKGPLIDPFSHGGYQGQPAPEWRPYRPPSARTVSTHSKLGHAGGLCRQRAVFGASWPFSNSLCQSSKVLVSAGSFCISDMSALRRLSLVPLHRASRINQSLAV